MTKIATVTLPRAVLLDLLAKAARGAYVLEINHKELSEQLQEQVIRVAYYTQPNWKYRYKEETVETYTHRCKDCGEQYDSFRPHSRTCPQCVSTGRAKSGIKGGTKRALNYGSTVKSKAIQQPDNDPPDRSDDAVDRSTKPAADRILGGSYLIDLLDHLFVEGT